MTENVLIDEFLNYLKFERHFSPHTAKCYSADLAQFCAFLVGDKATASGSQSLTARARTTGLQASAVGSTTPQAGAVGTAVLSQTDIGQKLRDVSAEQVKTFLAFLGTLSYSKSTVARKLATLRSGTGGLPSDPVMGIFLSVSSELMSDSAYCAPMK